MKLSGVRGWWGGAQGGQICWNGLGNQCLIPDRHFWLLYGELQLLLYWVALIYNNILFLIKILQLVVHLGSVLSFPYFVRATLSFGCLNRFKNLLLTWFDLTAASRIYILSLSCNFSCTHTDVSSTKPMFFLWTSMSTYIKQLDNYEMLAPHHCYIHRDAFIWWFISVLVLHPNFCWCIQLFKWWSKAITNMTLLMQCWLFGFF